MTFENPTAFVPDGLKQRAFWARLLYGAPAPTSLHINTSAECLPNGAVETGFYSAPTTFEAIGLDADALYVAAVASGLIVAHRHTGAAEVLIGVPTRHWQPEMRLDHWLLPLRYSFKQGATIGEVRDAAAAVIAEMYQNQEARHAPFTLQGRRNRNSGDWPRPSIAIIPAEVPPEPPDGGIAVAVSGTAGRFSLAIGFDQRCCNRTGAAQLLGDMAQMMQSFVIEPNRLVSNEWASWLDDSLSNLHNRRATTKTVTPNYCLLDSRSQPAQALADLERLQVGIAEFSPYTFSCLLEYLVTLDGAGAKLKDLRSVVLSAEPASPSLVNEWLRAHPNIPIIQTLRGFGTNCQVMIRKPVPEERLSVATLPSSRLTVRNRVGHSVPMGVPGEIWIRVEPYATEPSAAAPHGPTQWVNTGHWGKRTDDGIEWFGRLPNGETGLLDRVALERLLVAAGGVRFCVVVSDGERRLVAYVIPRRGANPQHSTLRAIAARIDCGKDIDIREVESLPLRSDGGIDRDALHERENSGLPRNAVDQVLIGIWSEMLKVPQVRIHDDFFLLGGHSVLAMQLTARIRRIFQAEISLRSVFDSPSIARISDKIVQSERAPGHSARLAAVWLRTRTMSPAEIRELLRKTQTVLSPENASPTR